MMHRAGYCHAFKIASELTLQVVLVAEGDVWLGVGRHGASTRQGHSERAVAPAKQAALRPREWRRLRRLRRDARHAPEGPGLQLLSGAFGVVSGRS